MEQYTVQNIVVKLHAIKSLSVRYLKLIFRKYFL